MPHRINRGEVMPQMIPLPTACQMAAVPYQPAYHAILSGTVPATRAGRSWQIAESDIPALRAAVAGRAKRKQAAIAA